MKKSILVIGLAAVLVGGLSGCAPGYGNASARNENALAQIHKGVTTKADVQRLLGTPTSPSQEDGRSVWQYQHIEVSALAIVPLANMVTNTMDEKNVTIYFDKKDVVEAVEIGGQKL